jgi:hypothetical protein
LYFRDFGTVKVHLLNLVAAGTVSQKVHDLPGTVAPLLALYLRPEEAQSGPQHCCCCGIGPDLDEYLHDESGCGGGDDDDDDDDGDNDGDNDDDNDDDGDDGE